MRFGLFVVAAALPLVTGGCVRTAWNVATAPVRAGSQVVDWTTTSQEEADRNYGRKMRKQEAEEGRRLREEERRRKREARRYRDDD
jgi:hypothetical protein